MEVPGTQNRDSRCGIVPGNKGRDGHPNQYHSYGCAGTGFIPIQLALGHIVNGSFYLCRYVDLPLQDLQNQQCRYRSEQGAFWEHAQEGGYVPTYCTLGHVEQNIAIFLEEAGAGEISQNNFYYVQAGDTIKINN